tara:strand:- start:153 stop:542 length:390 start_codon:yes stop_codon:yes gene_type:complete
MEPRWLTVPMVKAMQSQAIAAAGGANGIRDEALLESALDRPRNLFAHADDATLPQLAAAYGHGIIRNHPFIDGNKRAGILAVAVFLDLNGYRFQPDEAEAATIVIALAADEIDEDIFARWIADFTIRRT